MSSDHLDFLDDDERVPLPVDDIYFWLAYSEDYLSTIEEFLKGETVAIHKRVENRTL